jgi:hypothetical protein
MSFNQSVVKSVDSSVNLFIEKVSKKYNISPSDLEEEWKDISSSSETTQTLDTQYLLKCLKPELVSLCKSKGLRTTGSKSDLIESLQKYREPEEKKREDLYPPQSNILKKLKTTIPTIPIRKNQFGNLEDPNTSFIFDRKSKKVIGRQNKDGTVDELTTEDIDICNKYKYDYVLPFNLDKNSKKEEKIKDFDEFEINDDGTEDDANDDELIEEELLEDELLEEDDIEMEEEEFDEYIDEE